MHRLRSGTVLRTVDGGHTWRYVSPPGIGDLNFRRLTAVDGLSAVAMITGSGSDSRFCSTSDGGRSWRLAYTDAGRVAGLRR
jgi:photosystem II stability/assembly factor-like uncharacterized protein